MGEEIKDVDYYNCPVVFLTFCSSVLYLCEQTEERDVVGHILTYCVCLSFCISVF